MIKLLILLRLKNLGSKVLILTRMILNKFSSLSIFYKNPPSRERKSRKAMGSEPPISIGGMSDE
jgi:hypothetical protein